MGGCFCIPREPRLSWGPGECPGGSRPLSWLRWLTQWRLRGLLGRGRPSSKDGEMVVLSGSRLPPSVRICHSGSVQRVDSVGHIYFSCRERPRAGCEGPVLLLAAIPGM